MDLDTAIFIFVLGNFFRAYLSVEIARRLVTKILQKKKKKFERSRTSRARVHARISMRFLSHFSLGRGYALARALGFAKFRKTSPTNFSFDFTSLHFYLPLLPPTRAFFSRAARSCIGIAQAGLSSGPGVRARTVVSPRFYPPSARLVYRAFRTYSAGASLRGEGSYSFSPRLVNSSSWRIALWNDL